MSIVNMNLPHCDVCNEPWLPQKSSVHNGISARQDPRAYDDACRKDGAPGLRCGKCKSTGWDKDFTGDRRRKDPDTTSQKGTPHLASDEQSSSGVERMANGQEAKTHRYWMTFDLGLTGNYDHFYRWLDSNDAKECGSGLATFISIKGRDEIEAEIQCVPAESNPARIYLISRSSDGKLVGKFLLGGRKVAPWAGYADRTTNVEDVG
jgi:hypothetical protein